MRIKINLIKKLSTPNLIQKLIHKTNHLQKKKKKKRHRFSFTLTEFPISDLDKIKLTLNEIYIRILLHMREFSPCISIAHDPVKGEPRFARRSGSIETNAEG